MEKSTPHCKLPIVKALVTAGKVRATLSAVAGGAALGFDFQGIIAVIMELAPADFHKSMTTNADHRIGRTCIGPRRLPAKSI